MPAQACVAMTIGRRLLACRGIGLMMLLFYSSRRGTANLLT
jgi:hypothetical protein